MWSPYTVQDIETIERVVRDDLQKNLHGLCKFTKRKDNTSFTYPV